MKRVMIVSSIFAPRASIGAKRPTFLAKRLPSYGWDPVVLTTKRRCLGEIDPSLEEGWVKNLPKEEVSCGSLSWHGYMMRQSRSRAMQMLSIVPRALSRMFWPHVPLDMHYPWVRRARERGSDFARAHDVDLLWATAPPYSSLYLVYLIHQDTGIPYIMDYRDVRVTSTGDMTPKEKRDWEYENRVATYASGYSYVAPAQKDVLENTVPSLREKPSLLAHNWIEQEKIDRCPAKEWGQPRMLHGGSLYGGIRRIDGAVRAVKSLYDETGLQLENYGPVTDWPYLRNVVSGIGAGDCVDLNGPIPYAEYLSACKGAAVLLLLLGEDCGCRQHAGAIPGKLYDYLGCHRAILVIGPEGCEAGKMVEDMRRGIACVPDDYAGIIDAIQRLLRGETREGPLDLRPEAVAEFQSEAIVQRMAGFFDQMI